MSVLPTEPAPSTERRQPELISPGALPVGALDWKTHPERDKAFANWRRALLRCFDASPRVIKVGICVRDLAGRGYCFATDRHLAEESGVPQAKVSDALKALESGGAIIRRIVLDGNRRSRRIWLRADFAGEAPPTVGDTPIPHGEQKAPPTVGGQNRERIPARGTSPPSRRLVTNPQTLAAMQAEMRERRARGEPTFWEE